MVEDTFERDDHNISGSDIDADVDDFSADFELEHITNAGIDLEHVTKIEMEDYEDNEPALKNEASSEDMEVNASDHHKIELTDLKTEYVMNLHSCDKCGFVSSSLVDFKAHVVSEHGNLKLYVKSR